MENQQKGTKRRLKHKIWMEQGKGNNNSNNRIKIEYMRGGEKRGVEEEEKKRKRRKEEESKRRRGRRCSTETERSAPDILNNRTR